MNISLQRRRFEKKILDLENDLTVSGERSRHVISEVAGKDEELVVMKVENVTLQEKLKSRTEEVSEYTTGFECLVVYTRSASSE